jgi:PAS domain S-box-containing protein
METLIEPSKKNVIWSASEMNRLTELASFGTLPSAPDKALDTLTESAARLFGVAWGLLSLVDGETTWIHATYQFDRMSAPRDCTLCDLVVRSKAPLVLPDAKADPRFVDHVVVTGPPHLRFYASAPLMSPQGHCIGTLSVCDPAPRAHPDATMMGLLARLAETAMQILDQRRNEARLTRLALRAARVERMQAAMSAAASCEAALTAMLSELCTHHGATIGRIWKLTMPHEAMVEVARYDDNSENSRRYFAVPPRVPLTSTNSHTVSSIRFNHPTTVRYADTLDLVDFSLSDAVIAAGLTCQANYPILVQGERFGVVMSFLDPLTPLDDIIDDLASLEDIIRPALVRKIVEERVLLLGNALDRAGDGVLVSEAPPDGDIDAPTIYANTGFCEMFGYTQETILGRSSRVLRGPDCDPATLAAIDRAAREFRHIRTEVLQYRSDGSTLWVELDLSPITDSRNTVTHWVSIRRDITQRRFQEEAMIRSEKLKTVGQLTGGIAHDFNNLLTVVTLNLEEATQRLPEADPLQALLGPALHASLRGAELTAQLLSYARRAPLRPQKVHLAEALASLQPLLERSLGARFELRVALRHDRIVANVDSGQLENAVMNLIINARDAMPGGGVILLQADLRHLRPGDSELHDDMRPGDYVRITVTDEGAGIAPEILAHVFDPFFTTKEVGQGSGLGLSMVYGFARQSGGHVTLRSEVGRGTVATLLLPSDSATAVPRRKVRASGAWQVSGRRVLVVEDQPEVLTTVLHLLEQSGFDATGVMTADEAAQMLHSGARFDLLFSDIVLPGRLNGLDLAREARVVAPEMRILVTSGFTQQSKPLTDVIEAGAAFLAKPYKRQELVDRLRGMFPQG